jgi:hypothetical protein
MSEKYCIFRNVDVLRFRMCRFLTIPSRLKYTQVVLIAIRPTKTKICLSNLQEREHLECEVYHFLLNSEWTDPLTLKMLNY